MLLVAVVFLVAFSTAALALGIGFVVLETRRKQQFAQALRRMEAPEREAGARPDLVRSADHRDGVLRFLNVLGLAGPVERLLLQSGTGWTGAHLALFTSFAVFLGGAIGLFTRFLFFSAAYSALAGALVASSIPWMILLYRRKKRIRQFEEQFPEALDFLARSMRAGHGFGVSLEMLAADTAEPLASMVHRVSRELQLGAPMKEALENLPEQAPLIDVRFFVATVLLQQETGGNLSEVLNKLSYVIRERFKLAGDVRAASAHGRITALVLLGLPIFVALFLLVISPDYLFVLVREKEGRYMLAWAVFGQMLGAMAIRKIVNIKV